MASSSLAAHCRDLVDDLEDIDTRRGAEAAVEVMKRATAAVIGGDLRMSGLKRGGPARIEVKSAARNHVTIEMSGASYTLADKGRRRRVEARARRGSALATPAGPRASARGSTTRGHNITDRAGSKALDKAADEIVRGLEWGR